MPICMFPTNSERLISISGAFSAFVYGYLSSCPHAHCTPNKSVTTLCYVRGPGPVLYTGHACRHLLSAVPWISKDHLLMLVCLVSLSWNTCSWIRHCLQVLYVPQCPWPLRNKWPSSSLACVDIWTKWTPPRSSPSRPSSWSTCSPPNRSCWRPLLLRAKSMSRQKRNWSRWLLLSWLDSTLEQREMPSWSKSIVYKRKGMGYEGMILKETPILLPL